MPRHDGFYVCPVPAVESSIPDSIFYERATCGDRHAAAKNQQDRNAAVLIRCGPGVALHAVLLEYAKGQRPVESRPDGTGSPESRGQSRTAKSKNLAAAGFDRQAGFRQKQGPWSSRAGSDDGSHCRPECFIESAQGLGHGKQAVPVPEHRARPVVAGPGQDPHGSGFL